MNFEDIYDEVLEPITNLFIKVVPDCNLYRSDIDWVSDTNKTSFGFECLDFAVVGTETTGSRLLDDERIERVFRYTVPIRIFGHKHKDGVDPYLSLLKFKALFSEHTTAQRFLEEYNLGYISSSDPVKDNLIIDQDIEYRARMVVELSVVIVEESVYESVPIEQVNFSIDIKDSDTDESPMTETGDSTFTV